jgi:hypothetical protein
MIMDTNAMNPVLASIFTPERLKPAYRQNEVPCLLDDGLQADEKEIGVTRDSDGIWWIVCFRQDGQGYSVIGTCDACPACGEEAEQVNPFFTDPAATLRDWLCGASVQPVNSKLDVHKHIAAWYKSTYGGKTREQDHDPVPMSEPCHPPQPRLRLVH